MEDLIVQFQSVQINKNEYTYLIDLYNQLNNNIPVSDILIYDQAKLYLRAICFDTQSSIYYGVDELFKQKLKFINQQLLNCVSYYNNGNYVMGKKSFMMATSIILNEIF
jgi:hypothetical protein